MFMKFFNIPISTVKLYMPLLYLCFIMGGVLPDIDFQL